MRLDKKWESFVARPLRQQVRQRALLGGGGDVGVFHAEVIYGLADGVQQRHPPVGDGVVAGFTSIGTRPRSRSR